MDDVTEQVRVPAITELQASLDETVRPPVGAAVVAHPGWCDPRRCVEADGDVEHRSEPVSLRAWDASLELVWVRRDDADAEDPEGAAVPGDPELRIDITYCDPSAHTQLFLTPQEARQLGYELFRCCWRERCGRTPIAHEAPAVAS
ncbi:MAG: hypothetical protein JO272_13570 [Pseudonocardiales bacterium]|nr:hypothetical protein [Pseudonocardiales bacterium]